MITELCTCCGEGGRGFNEAHPQVWFGCHCLGVRRCGDCSRCFEHCLCVPAEQRLEALARERALINRSIGEARSLAEALGINEMREPLGDDTIRRVEQLLRVRYLAFKRFRRRLDQFFDVDHDRQGVERRLDAARFTVESAGTH
jgi:hypothetical protein